MTWDFIDFSANGILGQIIERFESEAIIYSEIIMTDKDGNTLLKINSTKNKIYTIGISSSFNSAISKPRK